MKALLSTVAGCLLLLAVSNPSNAQETANTLYHYDSGWQSDDATTSHETVFRHSLGVPPTDLTIWFAPALVEGEAEEVHPLAWSWHYQFSGNPVSIMVNGEEIILSIYAGAPLHGFWTSSDGWKRFNAGYWRVIARP